MVSSCPCSCLELWCLLHTADYDNVLKVLDIFERGSSLSNDKCGPDMNCYIDYLILASRGVFSRAEESKYMPGGHVVVFQIPDNLLHYD